MDPPPHTHTLRGWFNKLGQVVEDGGGADLSEASHWEAESELTGSRTYGPTPETVQNLCVDTCAVTARDSLGSGSADCGRPVLQSQWSVCCFLEPITGRNMKRHET